MTGTTVELVPVALVVFAVVTAAGPAAEPVTALVVGTGGSSEASAALSTDLRGTDEDRLFFFSVTSPPSDFH